MEPVQIRPGDIITITAPADLTPQAAEHLTAQTAAALATHLGWTPRVAILPAPIHAVLTPTVCDCDDPDCPDAPPPART